MLVKATFLFLFLLNIFLVNAQVDTSIHKKLPAVRTSQKIIIDGNLSDEAWKTAPIATNFTEREPIYGKPERYENRTEIKILYDDDAIYIAGYCHESNKDSLSSELVGRDMIGSNDFVGVLFDTYNDKINGFGYYVTPLGEQYDAKYSNTGEDGTWNSVYKTEAKIVNDGWTFEMRVPYSAIRFSNKKVQSWGMNIFRKRKKAGENLVWNPIDEREHSFFAQFGLWTDITNIKLPVRLSFSPYLSTDITNYPYNTPGIPNTTTVVNGGMDVKYGINQAFTLDMTLVPDFGQVQSDNHILNLSPFEVKYNEFRSFFTEGTELFSKGNIFYSRRIGGTPLHFDDVQNNLPAGDTILKNPTSSRIINATKISGRTASGLGIGVLNAVTDAQYATILNTVNKKQFLEQTTPLTNYNVFVLDQSLKHNSSISLINTNVSRNSRDYNANVTDGLWDLYDKKIKWNFFGKIGVSQLFGDTMPNGGLRGYNYNVNFAKVSGRFGFTLTRDFADGNYTHKDLGYFTNNNYLDHTLYIGYKWLKPHSFYNNMYYNFNLYYSQHYLPRDYQSVQMNTNINGQFKNLGSYYFSLNINAPQHDYYEPRTDGYFFKRTGSWMFGFYIQTNDALKFSYGYGLFPRFHTDGSTSNEIDLYTQYRFNKKLSANIQSTLTFQNNSLGYTTNVNDSVIFGLRRVRSVENIYTAKYNFSNTMGLSFRLRHYWSELGNHQLFNLSTDGTLTKIGGISTDPDYNVNYLNIDMVYTWQFRLGSFFTISWKNAIATSDTYVSQTYLKNLNNIFGSEQQNNISFKVIYFLDYLDLKKHHQQ